MVTFDQFEDTDRRSLTDDERVAPTCDEAPSRIALVVSGLLPIIFAIQLVGFVTGSLPVDGGGWSRVVFGTVLVAGLVTSTIAFISLYRRV